MRPIAVHEISAESADAAADLMISYIALAGWWFSPSGECFRLGVPETRRTAAGNVLCYRAVQFVDLPQA